MVVSDVTVSVIVVLLMFLVDNLHHLLELCEPLTNLTLFHCDSALIFV